MAGGSFQQGANTGPMTPEQVNQARLNAAQAARDQAVAAENAQKVLNGGTSWETTQGQQDAINSGTTAPMYDPRNFMYGRSPGAAQGAVDKAYGVGDKALGVGSNILQQDTGLAQVARDRTAPTGDFTQQNTALGQSLNYGSQLAGLEATQGPSAAQGQLQQGTNQALNSQLALARSGRGFGGNAAAMGLAQGNAAGIQANAANQSAMLTAQEDAAWRGRQATNYGNAAAISQGAGTQFGQQANTNVNAFLQNQGQNDAASLGYLGQGATAYGNGVNQSLAGQTLGHNVRLAEMQGGQGIDDRMLRAWSAEKGYDLAQQQADAQQQAAILSGVATVGAGVIGSIGSPAAGAVAAGAARAATS